MKRLLFALLPMIMVLVASCNKRTVTRVDPNKQIDLSGRWNDTDSRMVADAMIKDVLGRRWLGDFQTKKGKKPTVIVGIITNRSSEHIEAETFIKDIQMEFINSGAVRVVQNSVLREAIRKERGDQQTFASPDTQKKFGRELGADYMMFGYINSTEDAYGKKKAVNYKVNLELADMETNELVWLGNKEIKKFIEN